MKWMIEQINKYREQIAYIIVGGMTTLVYAVTYMLLTRLVFAGAEMETPMTAVSNCVAIIFAYFPNKLWVFKSRGVKGRALAVEFVSFFSSRLLAMVLNVLIVYIGVDVLRIYDIAVQLAAQVFVIVFNYVASKLVIFRKGSGK